MTWQTAVQAGVMAPPLGIWAYVALLWVIVVKESPVYRLEDRL